GDGGLILVVEIRRSEFGTKPNTWPLADTHLLGDTLKAFCEVKSPRDDWLDDQIEAASPGQIAGGARSDPTFNRIARHVDKAASQFDAVNGGHAVPNILVFVNHAVASGFGDLHETLTGMFHSESGERFPTMRASQMGGSVRRERKSISISGSTEGHR